MNFFVQVVSKDGCPGGLYGPGVWEDCVEKLKELLTAVSLSALGQIQFDLIESEGSFTFDNGGGIYIVTSEPL